MLPPGVPLTLHSVAALLTVLDSSKHGAINEGVATECHPCKLLTKTIC
jgi:hypothetical protein